MQSRTGQRRKFNKEGVGSEVARLARDLPSALVDTEDANNDMEVINAAAPRPKQPTLLAKARQAGGQPTRGGQLHMGQPPKLT